MPLSIPHPRPSTTSNPSPPLRVDDMFSAAFEGSGRMNGFPLHSLTPVTRVMVSMYTSLGTSLAGVITEPATLAAVAQGFLQALLWLLITRKQEFLAMDKVEEVEEEVDSVVRLEVGGLVTSASIEAMDPAGSWPSSSESVDR